MMKKMLVSTAVLVLCTGSALRPCLGADDSGRASSWDITAGVRGGYCHSAGHYAKRLGSGWTAGLSFSPWRIYFLHPDLDFRYAAFSLKGKGSTDFQSFAGSAGALCVFPVLPSMRLFAGLYFQESWIRLKGDYLTGTRSAFKPGLMARAGFDIPLKWGLMIRVQADYGYTVLSRKDYHSFYYSAGIAYSQGLRLAEAERRREDRGISEREKVEREKRKKAEADLRRAKELAAAKRPYEALQVLEPLVGLLPEAVAEQKRLRDALRPEIPLLERTGIEAYEKSDYDRCISIMNKLKLIDPSSRTVGIYLPRAVKRREALKNLR